MSAETETETETETEIESPCIGVCAMDEATRFCQGCYRTIDEIKQWWDLNNTQKQVVVDEANARLEQQFD